MQFSPAHWGTLHSQLARSSTQAGGYYGTPGLIEHYIKLVDLVMCTPNEDCLTPQVPHWAKLAYSSTGDCIGGSLADAAAGGSAAAVPMVRHRLLLAC